MKSITGLIIFFPVGITTRFRDEISVFASISASVVQGSALGPASYVVTAANLRPGHTGNVIIKYADDTYLVVPAANDDTCDEELKHIQAWADDNSLRMNVAKSKEIIFQPRGARGEGTAIATTISKYRTCLQVDGSWGRN